MELSEQKQAFITDIVEVMKKHEMKDLLVVYPLGEEIHNTSIATEVTDSTPLYENISDGVNAYLLILQEKLENGTIEEREAQGKCGKIKL